MTNDRFREALRLDFKGMKLKDKNQLKTLMRIAGYRQTKDFKKDPSQTQLDYAWGFLKGRKISTTSKIVKTRYGNRATGTIYINGKMYRKGQFVPRGK